jgi:hypothetical protein
MLPTESNFTFTNQEQHRDTASAPPIMEQLRNEIHFCTCYIFREIKISVADPDNFDRI